MEPLCGQCGRPEHSVAAAHAHLCHEEGTNPKAPSIMLCGLENLEAAVSILWLLGTASLCSLRERSHAQPCTWNWESVRSVELAAGTSTGCSLEALLLRGSSTRLHSMSRMQSH